MSTIKLLNNLPIEDLTPETDYLGLIDKGELIKAFLIGNKDQFNEIKMFSLYGEWGSGKSSLMKYLQKELAGEFNTFFFEAWEFEKDENLAMSLLEFITAKSTDAGEEICKYVLKYGSRILRGLGKSIKVNIPLYPNGPGIDLDPAAFVEEMDKKEELTFYKALEQFKTEFRRLEDNITRKDKKYNIIFIDDLDRCEPEQVLNLLSAIKLFFTYGEKTIFFCGVDKKAVEEAVKTKYGEIVKANEYLEKIFDISFTMPTDVNLFKLVRNYFGITFYYNQSSICQIVTSFFRDLRFTNPRRVKKVLNKFQILRSIKSNSYQGYKFPNIDQEDEEIQSVFETLIVLYIIILHEFYPNKFQDFLDFHKKRQNFKKSQFFSELADLTEMGGMAWTPLQSLYKTSAFNDNKFALAICPTNFEDIVLLDNNKTNFLHEATFFTNKMDIDNLFYNYMIRNVDYMTEDENMSGSTLASIKRLLNNLL